ncbi:winged helix-turn-helix transcriptional regulator [Halobacillus litoralis]|uniref:MarR family winged helix-turn-helix transcriptional regulator n=1 Tax=Halobacillus litoralis TaxID=45668 RepID=UPI001CD201F6|nr:winged helix-turn-helix transcriptional regulator [Halobacillus litoralis]MCA0969233.1 winged helix-turn-helix transcriptional regulator [Halobacillus litoralis]
MSEQLRQSFSKFREAMWVINDYVVKVLAEHEALNRYSQQQLETLRIIRENPNISQNKIATTQGVFKTAISNRIKKLQEDGLITINAGEDMRKKSISLTGKGTELMETAEEVVYQNLDQLLEGHFSQEEVMEFSQQLDKIVQLIKKD